MLNGHDMSHVPPSLSHGAAPSLVPGQETAQPSVPQVPQPVPVPSRRRVTFGRVTAMVLAIMFSLGSIGTNTTYLIGQGTTLMGIGALGLIAFAYELGLVALPTYLGILWRERRFGWFLVASVGLIVCFTAAVYAAAGFVNANFGDTEAARASALRQRSALQADLDHARDERGRMKFDRATQAQVDAARIELCKPARVEIDECRSKRLKHEALLERLTKTARADHLDKEIPRLQGVVDATRDIKAADPQVEAVVLMFSRMSRGAVVLDPRDAESVRLLTFVLLPMLAGLFAALQDVLAERKKS
jgi:hypothetical protein